MADTAGVESDFDLFDYLLNNPDKPVDRASGRPDARPPSPPPRRDERPRDQDENHDEAAEPEPVSQEADPPPLMALLDAPTQDEAERLARERQLLRQPGEVDWSDFSAFGHAATIADEAPAEYERREAIPGWAAAPRTARPGEGPGSGGAPDADSDGDPDNLVRLDRPRWDVRTATEGETATDLDPAGATRDAPTAEQATVPLSPTSDVSPPAPPLAWPPPASDAVPLDLPLPDEAARVIPFRPPAGLAVDDAGTEAERGTGQPATAERRLEPSEPAEPMTPVSRFASGLDDDLLPVRRDPR